jgi:hypothetical protein
MKTLLFFLFMLFSLTLQAQEGYVFTKEQHDQIRKNLQDYKTLIKDYNFKNKQYDSMKLAFNLLKKMHAKQTSEFEEMAAKYQHLRGENITLTNLVLENGVLKEELATTKRMLENRTHESFVWKRRYDREHRLKRGDRILLGCAWGLLTTFGMWTIYTSYETNYGF